MSGKFWKLITAFLFITHIYDVQSKCMPQDVKAHLDDLLLEEHMFEIKVFSPETKEHKLLSVINTLCSYWTNNKGKDTDQLMVLKTFRIMLHNLYENFEKEKNFCGNLNCTDAYTVHRVNTATFGEMYKKSCDGSVSDLKCPSKNKSLTTIGPTTEFSTTFLTTANLFTTDHKKESTTSSTTSVSPNITASENLTAVSSPHTETMNLALKKVSQNLWACSALLVVSFVLNFVLLFMVFHMHSKSKGNTSREEIPLQEINNSSTSSVES